MAFREFCPSWHGNHTHHFYAELENFGKGNVYSSSVMLVCVVLGLVITISGVTIILAKKAWRLQPRQPRHRYCRRRYYRGDAEADQEHLLPGHVGWRPHLPAASLAAPRHSPQASNLTEL